MPKFIIQTRDTIITSWTVEADNAEAAEAEIMSGGGLMLSEEPREFDEIVSIAIAAE